MKLRDLGEDAVVAAITRNLPLGPDVRAGAGDDCAVLGSPKDRMWRLLKTDAVVEGVHFRRGEKMSRVGWKALSRAISDIAAMSGVPKEAVITVAISPKEDLSQLRELYTGLRRAAKRFGVSLVGGETSRSPGPLFVSVALTGEVEPPRCVFRSGGHPDDVLLVTGRLGGSFKKKHLDFTPRLEEARWLTEHFRVHSMMDLSDGLGADLPRLAAASGCGFYLWEPLIPCSPGCTLEQALRDGEDFELLFSMSPHEAEPLLRKWPKRFPRLPIAAIGVLEKRSARSCRMSGFDHFG